jgi:hypothetical protein
MYRLDAIAVLARDHAEAVVFDLVYPARRMVAAADVGRRGAMNPVGRAGEGGDIDDND